MNFYFPKINFSNSIPSKESSSYQFCRNTEEPIITPPRDSNSFYETDDFESKSIEEMEMDFLIESESIINEVLQRNISGDERDKIFKFK